MISLIISSWEWQKYFTVSTNDHQDSAKEVNDKLPLLVICLEIAFGAAISVVVIVVLVITIVVIIVIKIK